MSRITCAISGIRFDCSYFDGLHIPHTEGYFHPIFAAPYSQLHRLYSAHTKGLLTSNDSYLLFIAFLHSSDAITWKHPAACNPNDIRTKRLVDANIQQLITVLEKSACIKYPAFKQPRFSVTLDSSNLESVPHWIKAWENNIEQFLHGRHRVDYIESVQKVENRLSKLILSGEKPERYSAVIADWACKVAEFPKHKVEDWKRIIRSCFSVSKMFNTPLDTLKEIKDYCECNIEVGSIHFHTLSLVLKGGISRHINYLGASNVSDLGYTLIPIGDTSINAAANKTTAELIAIADKAPKNEPIESEYTCYIDFLRAKLAYRVASNMITQTKATVTPINDSVVVVDNKGKEL